jgi:hypothetical protein
MRVSEGLQVSYSAPIFVLADKDAHAIPHCKYPKTLAVIKKHFTAKFIKLVQEIKYKKYEL